MEKEYRPTRFPLLRGILADRWWSWLSAPSLFATDGRIWSWLNPKHPGYPYDEATGSLLRLALSLEVRNPAAYPGAVGLIERAEAAFLAEPREWAGRDGYSYLFDTAICAAALARAPSAAARDLGHRMGACAATMLRSSSPVVPPHPDGARWSSVMGPHIVKACAFLLEGGFLGGAEARTLSEALFDRWWRHAVERARPGERVGYAHALCYLAEGLAMLSGLGVDSSAGPARAITAWLADSVARSGKTGLPEWLCADGRGTGSIQADATAQLVRLMLWSSPDRYRCEINAAIRLLGRLSRSASGVRYSTSSEDENATATIFALQAIAWAEDGRATPEWWV